MGWNLSWLQSNVEVRGNNMHVDSCLPWYRQTILFPTPSGVHGGCLVATVGVQSFIYSCLSQRPRGGCNLSPRLVGGHFTVSAD
jgi:hypothetical protein